MVDILVLGATGFTGRLIVRYLFHHPQRSSFTFAIGARSVSKGEELKKSLGIDESVPVVQVSLSRYEDIDAAVRDAKVVINAAGPYWLLGMDVVKACAVHGKRYVDLTGEPHFIRKIVDYYEPLAFKTGAIIVPASGFDSIPADLTVFLSNRTLKNALGPDAQLGLSQTFYDVDLEASGGSLATLVAGIEQVPRPTWLEAKSDYALSRVKGHPSPEPKWVTTVPFTSPPRYAGFWVMANVNRSVVQRAYGLYEFAASYARVLYGGAVEPTAVQQWKYGPQFRYEEYRVQKTNSRFGVALGTAVANVWMRLLLFRPILWLFKRVIRKPGQGPSEEQMRKSRMEVTNYTECATAPGTFAKTVMRGDCDAGYLLTSYFISECALAFVLDEASLPTTSRLGGIITPSTAFGDVLVRRLEATGHVTFESEIVQGGGGSGSKKDQ